MTSVATAEFLPVVGAASATKSSVVVSIHDVAPITRGVVTKILSELTERSVPVCSLLVVPDYHNTGSFSKDREFVSWLRQLETDGHEVVVHGYFHERPTSAQETIFDRFITRIYTQREGEFYDLGYDEALRRITQARDEFQNAGLHPHGFIAPAWLLNNAGERAARDAGMEYTTRLRTVLDLRSNEIFHARSLVYSVRNDWRRSVSLAWNAALAQWLKPSPLLRLSIHPPDYLYPRVWGQILDFINGMRTARMATTYQDWIAEQRITK